MPWLKSIALTLIVLSLGAAFTYGIVLLSIVFGIYSPIVLFVICGIIGVRYIAFD